MKLYVLCFINLKYIIELNLKLNIKGPGDVAVPSVAESTADILELARTREAHRQESAEVSNIKNRESTVGILI